MDAWYDLTVIQARGGKRLCKAYTQDSAQAYDRVYEVRSEIWRVFDLVDLHDALAMLEGMRDRCVLRGAPLFGEDVWTLRRMYDGKDGERAAFAPQDNAWICIDLDDVPRPDGWSDSAPVHLVDELVPPAFRGCGLVWQWSNGARRGKDIRAHAWYLADRAVCDASLRDWLATQGVADRSLYNPVQIHYTAAPVFEGMPDPFDGRRLMMRHGPVVTLPACVVDLATHTAQEQHKLAMKAERARLQSLTRTASDDAKRAMYVQGALKRAEEAILRSGVGGRHSAIVAEATSLWGLVLAGLLRERDWEGAIRRAGEAVLPASRVRSGEIDEALEWARTHGEERTI